MKNINSPSRVIALLSLSVCVHGAVLWAITEKVSFTALPEAPTSMWTSTEGTEAQEAPVEVQMAEQMGEPKVVKKAKKTSQTELPLKEVPSTTKALHNSEDLPKTTVASSDEPEVLDPEIQEEPQVNLIPVKESIAGVAPIEEEQTEAASEDILKASAAETGGEVNQAEEAMAAMGDGSSNFSNVRSYQSLKQVAGNKPPQYPLQARRLGQQGKVDLKYFVSETGTVKDVVIESSSGSELLDKEAVRAVSEYKFFPGQAGWTKHPVKFSLRGPQETIPARLRTSGSSLKGE